MSSTHIINTHLLNENELRLAQAMRNLLHHFLTYPESRNDREVLDILTIIINTVTALESISQTGLIRQFLLDFSIYADQSVNDYISRFFASRDPNLPTLENRSPSPSSLYESSSSLFRPYSQETSEGMNDYLAEQRRQNNI